MAAPTQDYDWFGGPPDKRDIPKGDTAKAVLGLVFAILAFALIALSFWFEAGG